MKTIDAKLIEVAMHPIGTQTFADIIQRLEVAADLDDVRKRDLISGLRRVADALGRQPQDTIADPHWLQPRLSKVAPAALRLSDKTWQNVVSNARAALAHFGIVKRRNRHIDDLQPGWKLLWQAVLASDDRTLTAGLGRFVHFLNILEVAPDGVTQAHADAFLVAVKADEIAKSPEKSWRDAVCAWTLATKRIDGWPQINLVVPKRQNVIKLPDEAMPAAFLADLAQFMHLSAKPDLFADEGPTRALAASTIKHRTAMLKRFASELIRAGVPEAEINSVAAICEPSTAKRGLQAMVARNDNKTNTVIDDMAGILIACAGRLNMAEDARAGLIALARRVAKPPQKGMTTKNRERLRVLRDNATLRRLLELPDKLCAMSRRLNPKATALAREDALAIAILLACPLRIGNISAIHIYQNLQRPGDGRLFLNFVEDEIKNHRPMEFEVPRDVRVMLDKHLANRSPLLCPLDTPWLFPRRDGTSSVDKSTLSTRLTQRIRKETGIAMNAHLFRHLAAMLWLDANPGSYEAVRRLLGHSSVSKTISFYTGLEAHSVFEAFGKVLTAKKGGR
ncbi:site-specific integrase [Cypionkella psychrotolerans]|uniref:site-specific integrase n=1 Tax=Cypionkella psychrotolerans TaxID=1678131 RepID=UPI0006B405EC|nr:site-specific integrase [Cypionkella psychrotolerans]